MCIKKQKMAIFYVPHVTHNKIYAFMSLFYCRVCSFWDSDGIIAFFELFCQDVSFSVFLVVL